MLVAEIARLDVLVPEMVPFVEAAGKTTVPLNVKDCPFKLRIPFVWVKAPETVILFPAPKVRVFPALFKVKLLSV